MSNIKIEGNASGTGTLTIAAPNTNTDKTLTLPDGAGEILLSDGDGSGLTGISSLFYDGSTKLATTSTGVSITGDLSINGSDAVTATWSNAVSGYVIYNSGLTIQWGVYDNNGSTAEHTVYYPITFTTLYSVTGETHDTGTSLLGSSGNFTSTTSSSSGGGNTSYFKYKAGSGGDKWHWIAIGYKS
jgi:hypothetical protein